MLEAGRVLGRRYEIISEVGSGGMANVYKARDQKLDRLVAIKVLRQEFTLDEAILGKFRKEALAAGGLNHPNIVAVYDMGHELGSEYIVMEYVDGITLKEYIRRRDMLGSDEVIKIAIRVAEALKAAHESGIVHRDIKPQNIMVTPSGDVKVTDFGIAKATSSNTMTGTGETMGSVHYLSPEQARGAEVDARSDLYSLGITMYEMTTKEIPFTADTPVAIAMKQVHDPLPNPRKKAPGMWPGLCDIIIKLTQKRPEYRYQTAEELIYDMKRLYRNPAMRFPMSRGSQRGAQGQGQTMRMQTTGATGQIDQAERERRRRAYEMRIAKEQAAQKKRKRAVIWIVILSVIAVLALVVLIYLLFNRDILGGSLGADGSSSAVIESTLEPQESSWTESSTIAAKTPDFQGMTYEDARQLAEENDLSLDVEAISDDTVDAGKVIRQDPQAGEAVPADETISIIVSLGAGQKYVSVPSLAGLSEQQATQTLSDYNLSLGYVSTAPSSSVPSGCVIDQSLTADSQVPEGSSVDITISSGEDGQSSSSSSSAGAITITQPFSSEDGTGKLVVNAYDTNGNLAIVYEKDVTYATFNNLGGYLTVNYPAGTTRIQALMDGTEILNEQIGN